MAINGNAREAVAMLSLVTGEEFPNGNLNALTRGGGAPSKYWFMIVEFDACHLTLRFNVHVHTLQVRVTNSANWDDYYETTLNGVTWDNLSSHSGFLSDQVCTMAAMARA